MNHQRANIPFSKIKLDVSKRPRPKYSSKEQDQQDCNHLIKLLPPPSPPSCSTYQVVTNDQSQIPLPPCRFQQQPPSRSSSSRKRWQLKKYDHDDPFLAAYNKCTKSPVSKRNDGAKNSGMLRKFGCFGLCLTNSIEVRVDNLVKVSRVSYEIDRD